MRVQGEKGAKLQISRDLCDLKDSQTSNLVLKCVREINEHSPDLTFRKH